MKRGFLTVVVGPMFSGKSTELLKRVLWVTNGENRPAYVYKTSFDNRYATDSVVSHDGLKTQARSIQKLPMDSFELGSLLAFDEVQFFIPPFFDGNIVSFIDIHLNLGYEIYCSGLDMDYCGQPFAVTASLMAMADEVKKLTANCNVCGRPASKTFKNSGSEDKIELGGLDKYSALCNTHWSYKIS